MTTPLPDPEAARCPVDLDRGTVAECPWWMPDAGRCKWCEYPQTIEMYDPTDDQEATAMTTETIEAKATRLVTQGRVSLRVLLAGGGAIFDVAGDSGNVWHVTVERDGATICGCPAVGRCAHQLAAAHLSNAADPDTADADPAVVHVTGGDLIGGDVDVVGLVRCDDRARSGSVLPTQDGAA
jgi:hypothetical protein